MFNKNEEKILQKLRERVLERDEELSQKEYLSATKEALVEMTKLSANEVNDIYIQLKKEEAEKQKKRNKVILYISVALVVLIYFNYAWVSDMFRKPAFYSEDFNKNNGKWSFINELTTSQYFENAVYIMDAHMKENKIDYKTKNIAFPKNYSIEVDMKKNSGEQDYYGIYLNQDDENFLYFFINSNGKFKTGCLLNKNWTSGMVNNQTAAIEKKDHSNNKLKIEVRGNNYKFFVNNQIVNEGQMNNLVAKSFSFAVTHVQKISFDNLVITNLDKNEILYQNNFDKEDDVFVNNKQFLRFSEWKEGAYVLTANVNEYCYWAWNWIPEEFKKAKKFEITVDAIVKDADSDYSFGIMLIENDKDYWTFDMDNKFGARYMVSTNGEYKLNGNYNSNTINKTGKYKLKLALEKNKINFYVNDIFVDKLDMKKSYLYWPEIEKVGFRVCDHCTVSYDNFQIKEIK